MFGNIHIATREEQRREAEAIERSKGMSALREREALLRQAVIEEFQDTHFADPTEEDEALLDRMLVRARTLILN